MTESTDPDRETIDEIRMRARRMAENEARVAEDRACIHELIRRVFPKLRGEPHVRGRLNEVATATGWTRDYVARIRDGKVSLPTQTTPSEATADRAGPDGMHDFTQEHGSDWNTLFCHPDDADAACEVVGRRGWPTSIVQGHRDVPTDTVWVNDAAGPLALPLAELGAAAAQLTPGGRLADAVRAAAKPLDAAGPGCER
jgi:hypothetical protein